MIESFERVDQDGSGDLDYWEFSQAISPRSRRDLAAPLLRLRRHAASALIRHAASALIRHAASAGGSQVVREHVPHLSKAAVDGLCRLMDQNGDGTIDLREYATTLLAEGELGTSLASLVRLATSARSPDSPCPH